MHHTPPLAALADANRRRTAAAAPVQVRAVRAALKLLGDDVPDMYAEAGRLRLRFPDATLAELGAAADPPQTKETITGRLRRLLILAERCGRKTA